MTKEEFYKYLNDYAPPEKKAWGVINNPDEVVIYIENLKILSGNM
jgi:hypothetical protein